MVVIIIYLALGYWAVGKTIYANKVIIYREGSLWIKKLCYGALLGWFLIPWALIKSIFFR